MCCSHCVPLRKYFRTLQADTASQMPVRTQKAVGSTPVPSPKQLGMYLFALDLATAELSGVLSFGEMEDDGSSVISWSLLFCPIVCMLEKFAWKCSFSMHYCALRKVSLQNPGL